MEGQKVAHYQIQKQLGQGGMGIVYLATDTRLDRNVALKFLPPELSADEDAKARFVQEAKAASALDHPNICTIHEIGEAADGKLFIAMAFYDGQTLKYSMDEGAMSESRATGIAVQIAEGLRKAHDAGITHRDIKPANIMVTSDNRVKVLDFGLAKLGEGVDLTKAGSTVGTTAYMSPEQSSGKEVDGRTDIWSLGVILYEMLAGKRAFGGGYDQAVLYSVLNEDPPRLENIDPGLADVVEQMINKDPDKRLGSADAVLAALDPFASGITRIVERPASNVFNRSNIWVGAVALAAVLFALWSLLGRNSDPGISEDSGIEDNLVAVLPFSTQGDSEMEALSEGMVVILGTLLDGAGDIYTVDHAAMIEQIRIADVGIVGPTVGQQFANTFRAGHFVLGSIVKAGNQNQISARLYDADGTPKDESVATYTNDEDFMSAVDVLAAGLLRGLLDDPDHDLSSLAAETTESFEALKYYLEAEPLVRGGRHPEAYELLNKALALDSTFALAWYLRAETQAWIDVIDGSTIDDLKMAQRYAESLSGRARRILDAEILFQEGKWKDAEAMYQSILRDYPNDLEATGQLAEVYVHYRRREDKQLEALRLFQKVADMTPGSQQFSFHHSDLLAFKGLLTGSFHGLDSLAAVYADLPIPEPGEQFDWSLALDRMNPETRSNMAKFARVSGTTEDSLASLNMPNNGFSSGQMYSHGLIDEAEASASALASKEEQMAWKVRIHNARGQNEAVREAVMSSETYAGQSFLFITYLLDVVHPAVAMAPDQLEQMEVFIENWDGSQILSGDELDRLRNYLMAQLSFKKGDYEAFASWSAGYKATDYASDPNPEWNQIYRELVALEAWIEGDLELAVAEMSFALPHDIYFLEYSPMGGRHHPYWYLAQLYEANGQIEEAIQWYKAVLYRPRFAPQGWENAARLYEQQGDPENAIRYYSLMANQWKNADPILQPRVQAARDRVEALLDQQTREPQ